MKDLIIGIDAGTSVIKSIAFSLEGEQIAEYALANHYETLAGGGAEQDIARTWVDCARTLVGLGERVPELKSRVAAISVTGQGDGTWLLDKDNQPVCPAWLWLDARAASLVETFSRKNPDALRERFHYTGTGFAACQQSAHFMWMQQHAPELLANADVAFHCKDWLYLNLTGERATDPTEACFTFGDFRTRDYSDRVFELLGLGPQRRLAPPIVDGVSHAGVLSAEAARQTGLAAGTPVSLGYVDVICTALGAGLYDRVAARGCSVVGSTGIHMRLVDGADQAALPDAQTGFTMPMPIPGVYTQMQSNMAATLNIDWLIDVAGGLLGAMGHAHDKSDILPRLDQWVDGAKPGALIYQPYISEAGERGPFIDGNARASLLGLSSRHRFEDIVRAVYESLALAARDCYGAMSERPDEILLTGGAARSQELRKIFAATLNARVRTSSRQEAGAAGAAMIAAVCGGHYKDINACVERWVTPLLGEPEAPDAELVDVYDENIKIYTHAREVLRPVWAEMAERQQQ